MSNFAIDTDPQIRKLLISLSRDQYLWRKWEIDIKSGRQKLYCLICNQVMGDLDDYFERRIEPLINQHILIHIPKSLLNFL